VFDQVRTPAFLLERAGEEAKAGFRVAREQN